MSNDNNVTSNQLVPGMVVAIKEDFFRVESAVKVTMAKGASFIKVRLKNLTTEAVSEKNFKLGQILQEVLLVEKQLEFLYPEGKNYLFLDLNTLGQCLVDAVVLSNNMNYLKEGLQLKATFYGDRIFTVELPQFLELMVAKVEERDVEPVVSNATKKAVLETGAEVDVPLFIEEGDIVKIDTATGEYVQRI